MERGSPGGALGSGPRTRDVIFSPSQDACVAFTWRIQAECRVQCGAGSAGAALSVGSSLTATSEDYAASPPRRQGWPFPACRALRVPRRGSPRGSPEPHRRLRGGCAATRRRCSTRIGAPVNALAELPVGWRGFTGARRAPSRYGRPQPYARSSRKRPREHGRGGRASIRGESACWTPLASTKWTQ